NLALYAEELHVERGWYCDIFYFPIFAEPGTEDEGGNSAVVDVNLESYTSLYPNPANESVNVVCSYKIKGYTLSMQQVAKSFRANATPTAWLWTSLPCKKAFTS
ncbi:MAG: hypothetical protein ACI3Z6_05945, partial [Candidatus Onthomorpha sp.]